MTVVAGPRNPSLAESLADLLDSEVVRPEVRRFPDGEAYVRVEADLGGEPVCLVQSTPSDRAWIELLLLQDAVASWSPDRLAVVVPYLGYARQDRRFEPGEALSAKVLVSTIGDAADALVTVDPHEDHVPQLGSVTARVVSATPAIGRALADRDVDLVLAPDAAAVGLAEAVADEIGADADHLDKTRVSDDDVRIEPKTLDVEGRRAAIVDDIVSTGGTMSRAAEALIDQGAAAVLAATVHGVFAEDALDRLDKAGVDEVLATDTIESDRSEVGVASVLAPAVRRILG